MQVYLAFAPTAQLQLLASVEVVEGATVQEALAQTDWLSHYPNILQLDVGIFANKVTWQTQLQAGDRVEIYRPLTIDPMKKRQAKMQIAKAQSAKKP